MAIDGPLPNTWLPDPYFSKKKYPAIIASIPDE